ncbi:esterase/lipase family protein [Actinophytocola sp.]|uniref:esterase/lipase family protein n=1 Tax=Actinophytocola sp. TaxID=1872138 RepID=UPI003D6AD200
MAVLFGGAAAVAATPVGGWWVAGVGFGTFVLVAGGYLVTDLLTRESDPPLIFQPRTPRTRPEIEEAKADEPSPMPSVEKQAVVVFVHGILSSAQAWGAFEGHIRADRDLEAFALEQFEYDTRVLQPRPDRRTPDLDTIARRLGTRFKSLERRYPAIVIVSHSMGGLVTQQFVARMLAQGQGERLTRIKRIIMFACPTAGSEYFGTLRALAPIRHNQEEVLRTLNQYVTGIQQNILTNVVHTTEVTNRTCPIPLRLYAGDTDNIVLPQSALGIYPDHCTGVVAGDHSSIIRPDSPRHESYEVLKTELEIVLEELGG